jgi:crossover junction endodeoxyribonuclease RuvC
MTIPRILGIDPGIAHGAFALLRGDTVELVEDLPCFARVGRSGRSELDLHALGDLLEPLTLAHAFIERAAARPGQGVTGMFRFGYAAGGIYGLLVGLSVAVTMVAPRPWQQHHGIGPDPDAARQRAVQLFPGAASRFARKKDCHRADALLIAAYGQHRLQHDQ